LYSFFLKKVGRFLIIEQEPHKVDAIIVLNGRDTERSLAAVDLYNKGYSNLIVMARGAEQPGSKEFWKRVGNNFDGKIFFQRAIESMGVPEGSFKLIGNGVSSTFDEAKVTKQLLKENGYRSILLVTSKWHSRRAYLTFRATLRRKDEIKIAISPSKYDSFDPDSWWKSRNGAKLVFDEYVKLTFYVITLRISPFI